MKVQGRQLSETIYVASFYNIFTMSSHDDLEFRKVSKFSKVGKVSTLTCSCYKFMYNWQLKDLTV